MNSLRTVAAVVLGAMIAILLAYAGAVVMLLATVGIPLGSVPWTPSAGEYGVLLLIAGTAALIGGRVARRIARASSRTPAIILAVLLGMTMMVGFSQPGTQWPTWWGASTAVVMAVGAVVGAAPRQRT